MGKLQYNYDNYVYEDEEGMDFLDLDVEQKDDGTISKFFFNFNF